MKETIRPEILHSTVQQYHHHPLIPSVYLGYLACSLLTGVKQMLNTGYDVQYMVHIT